MVVRLPSALAAAMSAGSMPAADAPADAPADAAVDGAAADGAAADGAVDAPPELQAANTKLATTRSPAIRVTFRWVDKVRPPVAYAVHVSKTGGLLPRGRASARPAPVWRTAARAAWSS